MCVAVLCGAGVLWRAYSKKATERRLAATVQAVRVRAEQGEVKAQYDLANKYGKGEGVPRDDTQAARWLRSAADQGDARAQTNLGVSYALGRGVPKDYAEAALWYRKAADQGFAMAQFDLAQLYDRGDGVPQDLAEAARWYRNAAEHGDPMGQDGIGFMYFVGHGVPQDYAESVRWYRKAAENGDVNAQLVLCNLYYRGQGVPRDYPEAARWFIKAAASCFAATEIGAPARWMLMIVVLLALPVLIVPRRLWRRARSLNLVMLSALFGAVLAHELLLSDTSLALLARAPLVGVLFQGFGHVLLLTFLATASALCALGAIVEAVRGSRLSGVE